MSLRSDPLAALVVPDGTTVEEHAIVTDRDVIVGTQSEIALGVRGRNVIAGERVAIAGDVEADADCRLDTWCELGGNVLAGADAYIGERVTIDGQLVVAGDLDIGDDVTIEEGFDANGWIVIRNPVPTLVFLFTYLTHLLRIGEEDLAEDVVSEVFDEGEGEPLVIPKNADVTDDAWRVSTPAEVGSDCRLHGNLRAESITVGERTEIFGSLRARESIAVESGTTVHGDVTTRGGEVEIAADAQVRGDIACERLRLHEGAVVEGAMRARGEMTIVREENPLATDTESADRATDEDAEPASEARPPSSETVADIDGEEVAAHEESTESVESTDRTEPIQAIEPIEPAATEPAADGQGSKPPARAEPVAEAESTDEGSSSANGDDRAEAGERQTGEPSEPASAAEESNGEEPPEPAIREAESSTNEAAESAADDAEESEEPKGSFTPPE
ncbi:polymer-forming cytoskeletal protein [Halococcus agarilyticus]|uniref:polymer-forming cytoskeletal protein n=1 Tax=Halococcus agarilyticus TaxID=1232219 RepID=UPI000677F9F5|nr:polymer-forming cytoskeletal protein [Halococcus agarilyticus]